MKAILKTLVSRSVMIVKRLFGKDREENKLSVVKPKTNEGLYNNIISLLKVHPDFPAYRKDARLLHRRLKQYQRLGWQGGKQARAIALKRLEKEWKRVMRNKIRKIKFDYDSRRSIAGVTAGKIIPVSSVVGVSLSNARMK